MQSHELLREVFQSSNPKEIAAQLGVSLSLVYKWAESDEGEGSGATNPLDRLELLWKVTQDPRLIQWICERAGGFFIKNHDGEHPHSFQLIPATNTVVQEFADLLSVIANAAGDSEISRTESKDIRARWEKLKGVTEGFVRCCEDGNFSQALKAPE